MNWKRTLAAAGVSALVGASLSACSPGAGGDQGPSAPATSSAATPGDSPATPGPAGPMTTIAENLVSPWSIVFHSGSALVSERDTGKILEITEGSQPRVVGEVAGVVRNGGEGGLLGLAMNEGQLFVYLSSEDGNKVVSYTLTGSPGSLGLGDRREVISGIPAGRTHNGGRIAFGPDGLLYIATGDAGRANLAQDKSQLAGKILRLRPEGSVPADNPFKGSPVYSYGHRNVQGMGWGSDGTMYATEFGTNVWDELNVIEAGGNYGWPSVEGKGGGQGMIDPVQTWATSEASPSGMAVVGASIYIANLRGRSLMRVPLEKLDQSDVIIDSRLGRLRDVVPAPDGSLWVLTNNTDGRGSPGEGDDKIVRIQPQG